jgi:hypothetical protein
MLSKPILAGLLALACVTAAAGGAFVAVRQNAQPPQLAAASPAAGSVGDAAHPVVHETEALIDPAPTPAEPEPALERATATPLSARREAAAPAPVRRPAPRSAASEPAANEAAVASESAVAAATPVADTRPAADPWPAGTPGSEGAPLPPMRYFEDVVIPASSVIGLQVETPVSSERARVEDRVEARVLRDVIVDGQVAVPAGSRAIGAVTLVERGGKLKERARLGVRFHTLVLADGARLPMRTDTILREGDSPVGESARKVGGAAAGGAILGAIIGGKKGAAIGGAAGAAGGTAVVMAGDRNPATLPVGAVVTVRLSEPLAVEVERR